MPRVAALALLAATGAVALGAQSQDPPPVTFRVEVNYVEVDATVTDAQGAIVSDLTENDFEVIEDGRLQKVASFALVNLPIERAVTPLFATAPIEADVQTNEHVEGRVYLLVLDDLHTDLTRAPRVKAAARRFIEQSFGTNDLAAVVYTSGRAADSQDFTNNRRLLLTSIDKFTGRKFRSSTVERLQNMRTDENGRLVAGDDSYQNERAHNARSVMNSIRKLADFMAGVRGRRKAMLLISEGIDFDITEVMGSAGATASSVLLDTQDAIAAATRGNVSIYAIDPRGLTTGTEDLISVSSTLPDQSVGVGSAMNEQRLAQDSLRELAASTGGFAALNQNDFARAFDRIVSENSSYYVLGYYSTNDRRDGRFRRLEVRVTRPGLRVRARSGYYAARGRRPNAPPPPPSGLSAAVGAAIGSPIPTADVAMQVFAAPFKGTAPNAVVAMAVEIDPAGFGFVQKNGIFNERVEMIWSATNSEGKIFPGERHNIDLTLKPDTAERVKAGGFRVLSQANLPPGRYQLRVAVGTATGKAGSVLYDLEVPDFYKAPLSMSGVAITSAAAAQVTTVRPKNPLGDFLPGAPTTIREFPRGDTLAIFAEFYENAGNAAAHMLDFRAELRAEGGRVVREAAEQRSSTELQGRPGGYGFSPRLTLDVDPGLYVLHVEGRSRAGNQPAVSRDILITLR